MARKWKYKLNIKHHFPGNGRDHTDEVPDDVVEKIRDELERDGKIEEILIEPIRKLGHIKTIGDFNCWLKELYEICDEKRVWLGS